MTQHFYRALIVLTFLSWFAMPVGAQPQPAFPTGPPVQGPATVVPPPQVFGQQASAPAGAPIVNVQVVISRYEGEKRVSSNPYTLTLVPGKQGTLRNGLEVAVPTTSFTSKEAGAASTVSYTMSQIGTSIDCVVRPTTDGKYELTLTVTERSMAAQSKELGAPLVPNVPTFRNVSSSSTLILGNGQSIQFTADRKSVV